MVNFGSFYLQQHAIIEQLYIQEVTLMEITSEENILKGNLFFDNKDYNSAFNFYFLAAETKDKQNLDGEIAWLYNRLGTCKYSDGKYKESLPFHNIAHDYSLINGDKITEENSIYNIALTHKKLNNIYEAHKFIDYFFQLFDSHEENKRVTLYAYAVILKSNCYNEEKKFTQALEVYDLVKSKFHYLKTSLIGVIYHNIAYLYLQLENIESALEYFEKAEDLLSKVECSDFGHVLVEKSAVYIKQKKYAEAIGFLERGIELGKKYGNYKVILEGYYLLEEVYRKIKDFDKLEEVYLKALNIIEESNDNKKEIFRIYMELSEISIHSGYMNRSSKYLELANKYCED
jgi:tetratricopeptide (TPR) repeat protein